MLFLCWDCAGTYICHSDIHGGHNVLQTPVPQDPQAGGLRRFGNVILIPELLAECWTRAKLVIEIQS